MIVHNGEPGYKLYIWRARVQIVEWEYGREWSED